MHVLRVDRDSTTRRHALASPALVLFLALFAGQAGVLVLSPILGRVAEDFDVSIAQAGQLRILAAPLAAVVALLAGRLLIKYPTRALLIAGSVLVAAGSLASAAAPTFALLTLAQVPMWGGIATLIVAAMSAIGTWSTAEERPRLVARAMAGAPAAWIVGMPLIGVVAEVDWRLAFLAFPLPAALLAGLAAAGRPRDSKVAAAGGSLLCVLRRIETRRWAIGELAANSAWAGTLVFSGALFTELYGASSTTTGLVLATVAASYLAGNQWAGRSQPTRARSAMLAFSIAAGIAVGLTWAFTPGVAVTVVLFAGAAFLVSTRMVAATVFGFTVAGDHGREVGTTRAVTSQLGYLIGSLVGGLALSVGGFALLSVAFGGLFFASTLPYATLRRPGHVDVPAGAEAGA